MQDQDTMIAIRDLKTYARKDREIEIEEQTIKDINSLQEQDTLWYIRNLRNKPRQVRATGRNQMDVSGVIITTDTLSRHAIKALIDSGCTGSCINEDFVKKHNLNTTKLPKSIPVFNADGSSNIAGRLTHTVQLQVIIGDHKEIMEFGVSNLGTSDVFLGHDWLKHHNPEIDWKEKMIQFNCCPGSCYKEEIGTDPEDDTYESITKGRGTTTSSTSRIGGNEYKDKDNLFDRDSQCKKRYSNDRGNPTKALSSISRRVRKTNV